MNAWRIRQAGEKDTGDVVDLLNEAADKLEARGIDQWKPGWMTEQRLRPMIQRGETFVVHDARGDLVATVSLSPEADPDFWTHREQKVPALYLAKLAGRPSGIGAWVLEWAIEYAGRHGYKAVRLDAWASNSGLHSYYVRNGWIHLRTMSVPGRNSGALFEHPARLRENEEALIIETAIRPTASQDAIDADAYLPVHEVSQAVVSGVSPFREEAHPLTLHLGESRRIWHDGTDWRVGHPGWREYYADRVQHWKALDDSPTSQKYVLLDEAGSVQLKYI
ncbi:GNAT family N-acetyltransferase [Nocardiopsis flavescens]|uniref:GNAT family N-acetyltransferase n=1 Tax=Nocardiopsis flavescens TaxID=758803 RepID=UPI0011613D1C|nr:GNAT family N-acetyltransferase [Nocardiopsis flavescens]